MPIGHVKFLTFSQYLNVLHHSDITAQFFKYTFRSIAYALMKLLQAILSLLLFSVGSCIIGYWPQTKWPEGRFGLPSTRSEGNNCYYIVVL